jgi:hypothetical protein
MPVVVTMVGVQYAMIAVFHVVSGVVMDSVPFPAPVLRKSTPYGSHEGAAPDVNDAFAPFPEISVTVVPAPFNMGYSAEAPATGFVEYGTMADAGSAEHPCPVFTN